jgi:hypothetical protein
MHLLGTLKSLSFDVIEKPGKGFDIQWSRGYHPE